MSRSSRIVPLVLGLTVASAPSASAQGNLSTFGFGYPPGQLSSRAQATGGAIAEMDPVSTLNPAALVNWGGSAVYFQIEPEFRRVDAVGGSDRTTTARYPLTGGALPIGSRWMVGIAASTFLDRSWATTSRTTHQLGGEPVPATTTFRSQGAINDVRVALAWAARPWLRVGLAGHALTGQNRLTVLDRFDDTTRYDPLQQDTALSYGGAAVSGGVEVRAGRVASVAASMRVGGRIRAQSGDATIARASVPNRFGVTVAYLGIANSAIAVRTSYDQWSSLEALGRPGLRAVDAWDTSLGADFAGPRFGTDRVIMLRAGARWRTLPFSVTPVDGGTVGAPRRVQERSLSAGAGTSLARGRAAVDVGVIRAARDAGLAVDERAWILSIGLSVRP
ncbi:MAG: hypothetical protein ABR499_18210 [Gemmatimonadaceae bacterium]